MKTIKLKILSVIIFGVLSPSWAGSADWMEEYAGFIGNKPLNQVILPGSHDSATYKLEHKFGKNQDITSKLNILKYFGVGFVVTKIAKNWSQAQDRTIYQQLNDGIRYLDLRVIYRDSKKAFYTVHGLYGPALKEVLEQTTKFLSERPKEIVVIQIGDLRYMGADEGQAHEQLVALLENAFGNKIIRRSEFSGPTATPNDLWAQNKQVFLIYNNDGVAQRFDSLWPQHTINSYWANMDKVETLKTRLDQNLSGRSPSDGSFFVVQSQLTGTETTIKDGINPFGKRFRSLKDMADAVRAVFPAWLNDWKDKNPNIIIVDFADPNTTRKIFELNRN